MSPGPMTTRELIIKLLEMNMDAEVLIDCSFDDELKDAAWADAWAAVRASWAAAWAAASDIKLKKIK